MVSVDVKHHVYLLPTCRYFSFNLYVLGRSSTQLAGIFQWCHWVHRQFHCAQGYSTLLTLLPVLTTFTITYATRTQWVCSRAENSAIWKGYCHSFSVTYHKSAVSLLETLSPTSSSAADALGRAVIISLYDVIGYPVSTRHFVCIFLQTKRLEMFIFWRTKFHFEKILWRNLQKSSVSRGTSHVSPKQRCKYTTWVDIQNALQKAIQSLIIRITCDKSAVSARERRTTLYKSD